MHASNYKTDEIVSAKQWALPINRSPLQILMVGKKMHSKALALLLQNQYEVILIEDEKDLSQTVNEHEFSLIVIFFESLLKSAVDCIAQLKANPFCAMTSILVILPISAQNQEFKLLEIGAIDCIFAPVKPIIVASKIKNHLALAQQTKQLELASCTDGLTGLNNRTQLDTVLVSEWFHARRAEHAISVLMIDVDFFKLYNDKFGHIQGDECLKLIASVVQNAKRRGSDFAARFGGEEFILVLPFTEQAGAEKMAQELIARVRQLNIASAAPTGGPVTISVGIATSLPNSTISTCDDPWQLVELADANLYQAKKTGRNKYC